MKNPEGYYPFYFIGPRSAWDHVHIGPFRSLESAKPHIPSSVAAYGAQVLRVDSPESEPVHVYTYKKGD